MTIRTAMLLAAGKGTRMRPLTDTCPKPLIEVAGRTLLDRALDKLVAQGVERAVVNVHYLADQVEAHVANRTDVEILISDERAELLETGGGVMKALPMLGDDPFYVVNTDVTWVTSGDTTFADMASAYDPARMDALLLLAPMSETLGFRGPGDFYLETDQQVARRGTRESAPYVFAGTHITRADRLTKQRVEAFSANRYWSEFNEAGRLFGTVMAPFGMHVGDPAARDEAEHRLLEMESSS